MKEGMANDTVRLIAAVDFAARKHRDEQVRKAPYKSPEAKLVKLADKTCNLRDLLAGPQSDWPQSRLLEYTEWAARVVEGIRGENPDLEGAFDAAFDAALERFGDRS